MHRYMVGRYTPRNAVAHFTATMGYEQLYKEFHSTDSFVPFIDLNIQPKFAICGLLITLTLISSAFFVVGSKSSFFKKFFLYTILSIIGSLFAGLTTVFATNSFGVYV